MSDRDRTLLPLREWTGVLEQLSLPLRAYQRQFIRSYEPVLLVAEKLLQAYGGWMRHWERSLYGKRPCETERTADCSLLWSVCIQAEQMTSSLVVMLDEQTKLLASLASRDQEGTRDEE